MPELVFIASYFKSGNTWVRGFLTGYTRPADDVAPLLERFAEIGSITSRWQFDVLMGVPSVAFSPDEMVELRSRYHDELSRRQSGCYKTHDAYARSASGRALFSRSSTRAAVYLVRDPRDVAISFSHHESCTVDEILPTLNEPGPPVTLPLSLPFAQTDWSTHVTSWLDQQEVPLLTLRYEDMLADPSAAFRKVLDHLGLPFDPVRFEAALGATSFAKLKAEEARHGFGERPAGMTAFFREGRAGQWREVLSEAQVRSIEGRHGAVMRRLGYLADPRP